MKNTIKIISTMSAALLCLATAFAQADTQNDTPSWFDKLTVGETADGNLLKDNGAASINFTSPSDGEDSYAMNIGVSYLLMDDVRWAVSPIMEYNRNTALKQEQDVLLAGVAGSYTIGDPATFAVWTDGALKYKWDGVSDDESWMPTLMFTPLYSPFGLGSSLPISDILRIQPELSGGVVYEDAANGADGNTLRAKVEAGVTLVPLVMKDNKLTFTLSNTYRKELTASGKFDDGKDDFNIFKVKAIYYLIPKEKNNDSLGVKLEYWNGEDPDNNLEDQSAVTFGFVFSL
ncbi:hypothetical protein VU08_06030 [Desulfobulbus sp. F5]|nr:hypothetical protein [Desulfobulbus sp. F5]